MKTFNQGGFMSKTAFNYIFLKDKIAKKFGSQSNFAKAMNISYQEMSNKINNKTSFSQDQIYTAVQLLNLSETEVVSCFFNTL